jgi:hypothetical protein
MDSRSVARIALGRAIFRSVPQGVPAFDQPVIKKYFKPLSNCQLSMVDNRI